MTANDLPEPEELAADAIAELEGAVEELNAILSLLENSNSIGAMPKLGRQNENNKFTAPIKDVR